MYDEAIYAALRAGEFELNYLPTVRLSDGCCVGAEALIRWRHEGTWVEPAEFIPRAEGSGLGGLITYWVIDTVAAELKNWLVDHPQAHISINVPPDVLGRGGIEYAGAKSGLAAVRDQIVLEVTERGVPDAQGIEALDHMARNGVRIALDDVTMDGANLALLSRCRFDFLKIDRHITTDLREDALPDWLLGLRALLAHASVQVVAEGVESAAQAALLHRCGVGLAQGHLYSPALPVAQFREYFARNGAVAR